MNATQAIQQFNQQAMKDKFAQYVFFLKEIINGNSKKILDLNGEGLLMRGISNKNYIKDVLTKGCVPHGTSIGGGLMEIPQIFMHANQKNNFAYDNQGIKFSGVYNDAESIRIMGVTLLIDDVVKKVPTYKEQLDGIEHVLYEPDHIPPSLFNGIVVNHNNVADLQQLMKEAKLNIPIYVAKEIPKQIKQNYKKYSR